MSLGILKRFREKNAQFFFRDFNFVRKIQRLLQEAGILISLVPSNIINTLDNAPSFLVDSSSVSSVFD